MNVVPLQTQVAWRSSGISLFGFTQPDKALSSFEPELQRHQPNPNCSRDFHSGFIRQATLLGDPSAPLILCHMKLLGFPAKNISKFSFIWTNISLFINIFPLIIYIYYLHSYLYLYSLFTLIIYIYIHYLHSIVIFTVIYIQYFHFYFFYFYFYIFLFLLLFLLSLYFSFTNISVSCSSWRLYPVIICISCNNHTG